MAVRVSLAAVATLLAVGCSGSGAPPDTALGQASGTATATEETVAATGDTTDVTALKLLRVAPESGFVGDQFDASIDGLPPGATVDWQWATWDGTYRTEASGHDVNFMHRSYRERRVSLGQTTVDDRGRAEIALTAPRDFGGVHDLYAVVDGYDLGRGGYSITRRATIAPSGGPVGTPITVEVTGLAPAPFESTMALRYDNAYTGFVSAVTTAGSATFRIRAAGPVGRHTLQLTTASPGVPFLNNHQSGTAHVPNMDLRFPFTVTEDAGPPPQSSEWPDPSRVASAAPDGAPEATVAEGVVAELSPTSGEVGSAVTLRAGGLPPSSTVQLEWARAGVEDPNVPPAFREGGIPLAEATTGGDGSLSADLQVQGERGGWHVVRVVLDGVAKAEIPFYVRRSLEGVTPQRVRLGEQFTVELRGSGWTELDKGVAVTYDNSYIGYACSVASGGDVTLHLVATGAPGTHLIDLYPMLYRDAAERPAEYWDFELPQLTALDDHPGIARGYELPIFRLAIEVIE